MLGVLPISLEVGGKSLEVLEYNLHSGSKGVRLHCNGKSIWPHEAALSFQVAFWPSVSNVLNQKAHKGTDEGLRIKKYMKWHSDLITREVQCHVK